jgi:hypothetical protein
MVRFLFKQPKPKRFDYKPRFYNEQKERLQARVEVVRREVEMESGQSSPEALRSRMQSAWRNGSGTRERKQSNKTIFIITGLLAIIAYLLLYR